jgi:hypothetical protein
MFTASRWPSGGLPGVVRLNVNGKCDMWIVVGDLYHDQAVGSVCPDTYFLVLNPAKDRVHRPASARQPIRSYLPPMSIEQDEARLWKKALPLFVERSRYTWEHKPSCEYKGGGVFKAPLSLSQGQSPICSCGEGQDVGKLHLHCAAISRFVTRAAIPLLSGMPYVEPMAFDQDYPVVAPLPEFPIVVL